MQAIYDFLPQFCPHCGAEQFRKNPNSLYLENLQLSKQDYYAGCGHSCKCDTQFIYSARAGEVTEDNVARAFDALNEPTACATARAAVRSAARNYVTRETPANYIRLEFAVNTYAQIVADTLPDDRIAFLAHAFIITGERAKLDQLKEAVGPPE